MINYVSWNLYTRTTNSIRFTGSDNFYVLGYLPETGTLLQDYLKLNLRHVDFRYITTPITTFPRTYLTPVDIKQYKKLKLIPLSIKQKIPEKNIILDFSKYIRILDSSRFNSRQRRITLLYHLLRSFSLFPDHHKILLYSVDINSEKKLFIDTYRFSIASIIKNNDILFDDLILATTGIQTKYRLLMKDKNFNFQKLYMFLKNVKFESVISQDTDLEDAVSKVLARAIDRKLVKPSNKDQLRQSLKVFFRMRPSAINHVLVGKMSDSDTDKFIATSVLASTSGDVKRAKEVVGNIKKNTKEATKTITNNLLDEIVSKDKIDITSNSIVLQSSNIMGIVENKEPSSLFKKRQVDFQVNLLKDTTGSFKVLENKEIPLYLQDIKISDTHARKAEIEKSDITYIKATLIDKFDNKHNIKIEIPKINEDGTFRLNGKRKCLINQVVSCPISFPKPYQSKFESSYSAFHISSKRTRKISYLEIYIASYRLPLLVLLAFAFGFDETLRMYNIAYKITDKKSRYEKYYIRMNKKYVIFENVDTELKKELVNSMLRSKLEKFQSSKVFGTMEYFTDLIVKSTGRINSTYKIKENIDNIVDPVARQVLMNQSLPTDLPNIIQYMTQKTVEGFEQARNDISNMRIRNSEILVHLAQKQILAAYTTYKEQVLSGNTKAKFTVDPTKVISGFLNSEIVVDMEYGNPLEEMTSMTKISPVGKGIGGIPGKDSIQIDARNVHDSYYGNIDPLDTPEGSNIGIVQQLTVNALLTSARGIFHTKKKINSEKSGILSTSSVMVPFIENNEGARIIMSDNQSRQVLPLKDPEPPMVQTGYESILTNTLSDNFIKKSTCSGKVSKITDNEIIVDCKGKKEKIDLTSRTLKSGSGKNTLSIFKPVVKVGQKIKTGQLLAEGSCIHNGTICMGRNLLCAVMPYEGFNFEDGVVINEKTADKKLTSLHLVEVEMLLSDKDKVIEIAKIGQDTRRGDILIRKSIGELDELLGFDEDEVTTFQSGQLMKKSPGGKIVDIDVYCNVTTYETDFPILKELINKTNTRSKKSTSDRYTRRGIPIDGILVNFKIQQELKSGLGDKLCNRFGNKGIISLVEKDDLMPRTPWGERLDFIINPLGIINRMNIGQLYELHCGLISKKLASIITSKKRPEVTNILRNVLLELDGTEKKIWSRSFMQSLDRMKDVEYEKLVNQVRSDKMFPVICPPFQSPKKDNIRKVLGMLGLKSKYKLFLPKYNTMTYSEVPVGYQLIQKLEHLGAMKIGARSTGPLVNKVFQPTAGKVRGGGQRLGELDTYALLSVGAVLTLQEELGPMSDDMNSKNEMISEIIQNGDCNYRFPKMSPTKELLDAYFISMMLQ